MMKYGVIALSVACCSLPASVAASTGVLSRVPARVTPPESAAAAQNPTSGADKLFILETAQSGLAQTELSKLAEQKATNSQVKDFARKNIQANQQLKTELQQIAHNQGVTLPATMDEADANLKSDLEKQSGAAFDRMYMEAIAGKLQAGWNSFRDEAKATKNPALRTFAADNDNKLHDSLENAQAIAGKLPAS